MYIISACLLGENCKYNGGNNLNEKVMEIVKNRNYIAVCPEVAVGFPTPRPPAEIRDGRVYNIEGKDVTEEFEKGAAIELARAKELADRLGENIELAILKSKSPSCGCGRIYDGTFTHRLAPGDGIFARLLKENGIKTISEEES
ncbi:MAG: DUF523 domain-containing protein [Bacillota bacterium]|jgi:uncharacterized protein YbbK (DUF523 family)|nr:DUF523 domain-containing protein [Bacillota bacterium]NLM08830.1 DUF523 domain-containing protein [Clostridiales Family XIII bacterium]